MNDRDQYDVVIAGGSIAGCTAAMLYGRAGLRVAVVERNRRIDAYKALCGHVILGGTREMLVRCGLWDRLVAEGAASGEMEVWTRTGWLDRDGAPPLISLRRSKLDPMLRRLAMDTPGVDLLLGHTVTGLLEDGKRVTGLHAEADGTGRDLTARLVVGADGHRSKVARLAGARERTAPNERFLFWAYYEGVPVSRPRVWLLDPDLAVAVPTDEGLTLVAAFPTKSRLGEFTEDRAGALEAFAAALPDAPDMDVAVRKSKVIGTSDYPCVRRDPTPRPGLALIGDAATAGDPVPAVGCGWAFRSAEWLVDETATALATASERRSVGAGLRRYRRRRRVLARYDALARADAKGRPANPVQRVLWDAAPNDPEIAARLLRFAMRAGAPSHLLNPATVLRAVRTRRAVRADPTLSQTPPKKAATP